MKTLKNVPLFAFLCRSFSIFFLILLLGVPGVSHAGNSLGWPEFLTSKNEDRCRPAKFSETKDVALTKKPLFLVVHPQYENFDLASASYAGLMRTYEWVQRYKIESVVLVEDINTETPNGYFFPTCHPNYFVKSVGGEFKFDVKAQTVVMSGGFFSACYRKAFQDLLTAWGREPLKKRDVIMPLESIYEMLKTYDGSKVEDAPEYKDIVAYQKISGSYTMNMLGAARTLDKERFVARMKSYFGESIEVQGIGESKIEYPKGYTVVLEIGAHQPNIATEVKLVDAGPKAPQLKIHLVDGQYMIGVFQTESPVL